MDYKDIIQGSVHIDTLIIYYDEEQSTYRKIY